MNANLLKAKMKEFGDTQVVLAAALGISRSRLMAKINGVSDFRQNEILFIKDRYALTASEINSIFFSPELSLKDNS